MTLRPTRIPLTLGLAMTMATCGTAETMEQMLARLRTGAGQAGYGAAPWVSGQPEGYRFSTPGNGQAQSKAYQFNPAGFVVMILAMALLQAAKGGPTTGLGQTVGTVPGANPGTFPGTGPFVPRSPGSTMTSSLPTNAANLGDPTGGGLFGLDDASSSVQQTVDPQAVVSPTAPTAGALPPALAALGTLSSAAQIDDAKARVILEAGGYFASSAQAQNHGDQYQKALKALGWGWTFQRQRTNLTLDSTPRRGRHTMRTLVFFEYQRMVTAYAEYAQVPNFTAQAAAQPFGDLVKQAAAGVRVPGDAVKKERLINAQLQVESRRRHWSDHKLTRSFAGAGGAGQVMPAHSLGSHGQGRNYYDPGDAFQMHVSILNEYLGRARGNVRNALAMYNGGPGGYRRAGPQGYARKILQAAGW